MNPRETGNGYYNWRGGQIQRIDQMNPFNQIQQIISSLSSFNNGMFMNSMMPFRLGFDPLQAMYQFSDLHKGVHEQGRNGSYHVQSYVSSTRFGSDGNMIHQNYFENNMGEHRNGNTISQKQQAYRNNCGVKQIAEERMFNDRGRKIVREKRGGNVQETNHYYNMDEEDVQMFDQEWRQNDQQMHFLENYRNNAQQVNSSEMARIQHQSQPQIQFHNHEQARNPWQPQLQQPYHQQRVENNGGYMESYGQYPRGNQLPTLGQIQFSRQ